MWKSLQILCLKCILQFWNAFDAAAEGHPAQNVVEIHKQAAMDSASNSEKLLGNGGHEVSHIHFENWKNCFSS